MPPSVLFSLAGQLLALRLDILENIFSEILIPLDRGWCLKTPLLAVEVLSLLRSRRSRHCSPRMAYSPRPLPVKVKGVFSALNHGGEAPYKSLNGRV
jgi:hypothetical protein